MNPVCKVVIVVVGLLLGLIFAMMIPANLGKFAKEMGRSGLRQGKLQTQISRRAFYAAAEGSFQYFGFPGAVLGASGLFGGPHFPGIPCYQAGYDSSQGRAAYPDDPSDADQVLAAYMEGPEVITTDDYDSAGCHWPSRQNVYAEGSNGHMGGVAGSEALIPFIQVTDGILALTPFAFLATQAGGFACIPSDCLYTGLGAPATHACVLTSNWTTCDCHMPGGLPLFAGEGFPNKLNIDKKLALRIHGYRPNGVSIGTAVLLPHFGLGTGFLVDFGGVGFPGAVFAPAYYWSTPDPTIYAKTTCVKYLTSRECWTVYIMEGIEASGAIMAPVSGLMTSTIFLFLDLLTFMVLFLVTGSGAKVGPAK